jgi:hypothetical protein
MRPDPRRERESGPRPSPTGLFRNLAIRESRIQHTPTHIAHDLPGIGIDQGHGDARIIPTHQRRNLDQPNEDRVRVDTEGNLAVQIAAHVPGRAEQRLGIIEDAPDAAQKFLAFPGQDHALGRAMKENNAKLPLQRLDVAADRRLTDKKALGRAGQMILFSHGHKSPQMVQIHVFSITKSERHHHIITLD